MLPSFSELFSVPRFQSVSTSRKSMVLGAEQRNIAVGFQTT